MSALDGEPDAVRAELAAAVEADQTLLGDVWRRTQAGETPEQIRAAHGFAKANFVWNYRRYAKAVVDGNLPTAPTVAEGAAQNMRRILKEYDLSTATKEVLESRLAIVETRTKEETPEDLLGLFETVLALQDKWTKEATEEMKTRGVIVRRQIPAALKEILPVESSLPFVPSIEGQDGAGLKARVPWIRIFSKEKSPRPGTGWYLVFLFAADGSAVYLALGTGVTELTTPGNWKLHPEEWIDQQVDWARTVTAEFMDARTTTDIALGDPGIGLQYERATAFAIRYDQDDMPAVDTLQADLENMLSALSVLYTSEPEGGEGGGGDDGMPAGTPVDKAWLVDRTLWTESELDELLAVLEGSSPQVILSGPPGTGKSWIALAVAEYLTSKDHRRWRLVQFHPSYGYESFIQGLRPTVTDDGAVSFELMEGILIRMAEAARLSSETHVLILDEMNRANIPRVLGELMFLFEYRDEMIDLQFSPGFTLPKNLTFVATMNTADRSIRSIDTALRRRFEIFECLPNPEILERFYDHGKGTNHVPDLKEGFLALNTLLEEKLDRHHTIGQTFFMAKEMNKAKLRQVWERKIRPMIEEYFFDVPDFAIEFTLSRFWPSTDA